MHYENIWCQLNAVVVFVERAKCESECNLRLISQLASVNVTSMVFDSFVYFCKVKDHLKQLHGNISKRHNNMDLSTPVLVLLWTIDISLSVVFILFVVAVIKHHQPLHDYRTSGCNTNSTFVQSHHVGHEVVFCIRSHFHQVGTKTFTDGLK